MDFRPIEAQDAPALKRFFARIPEADRTFLKEDVDDPAVLAAWAAPGTARTIAIEGGEVVGSVAVVPLHGWSSHVGEIRLVVDPEHRGLGVGRALARHAVHDAVDLGLAKLVVEVIADQTALIAMFGALGFDPEALFADHVRDRSGQIRDLLVLANDVESQFTAMATAGITGELQRMPEIDDVARAFMKAALAPWGGADAVLDRCEAGVRMATNLQLTAAKAVRVEPLRSCFSILAGATRDVGAAQLSAARWFLDD